MGYTVPVFRPRPETGKNQHVQEKLTMAEQMDGKQGGLSRRDFITAAAGAAVVAGAAKQADASVYKSILPSTVLGANEKIRTGHIGTGGMGRADLKFAVQNDNFAVTALCDLFPKNLERAAQLAGQKFPNATKHHDFREIIDNKDIDAVVIATPDHWHCLTTLYASEAGKFVYCEKPLSTTIAEAHAMLDTVKKNKTIFQGGNMQRSGEHFKKAVELVKSGYIGDVAKVETFSHDNTDIGGIGMGDTNIDNPQFAGVDWDFHQGWVAHRPFNKNRWIYNFRWYLDYSGGKITDWGAHLIDIVMMAMGDDLQPKSVTASGGKFLIKDSRTTPDTLDVNWRFDKFVLSFSNRVWNPQVIDGTQCDHGIVFYGTRGVLRVDRLGLKVWPSPQNQSKDAPCEKQEILPSDPNAETALNTPHWQNFADAIKTGAKLDSPIDVLFNTTRVCHIGTCAYVAGAQFASGAKFDGTGASLPDEAPTFGGTTLNWDADTQKFTGGDAEAVKIANNWAYREYANGWSLKAPHKA